MKIVLKITQKNFVNHHSLVWDDKTKLNENIFLIKTNNKHRNINFIWKA